MLSESITKIIIVNKKNYHNKQENLYRAYNSNRVRIS